MPVTPIQRLKAALCDRTSGGSLPEVAAFARANGINGRIANRASRGIEINASDYLRLCAALGLCPVTGGPTEPKALGPLDWRLVGLKVCVTLIGSPGDKHMPMRKAAKSWRIALAALARMKSGQPVSIDNLLKLCRGLGVHPHMFIQRRPPPPMFHGEQSVEQKSNEGRAA